MSKLFYLAIFGSVFASLAVGAQTAAPTANEAGTGQVLEIAFSSVDPQKGKLWVGVCTESQIQKRYEETGNVCSAEYWVQAAEGATISIDTLDAGVYAITAFHDEDDNGQLDFDTRGIPFEATGNGNNAKGSFGPPTFKQMKFTLPERDADQAPLRFVVKLYRVGSSR